MSDARDEDEPQDPPMIVQPEQGEDDQADEGDDFEGDAPNGLDGPYSSRHFHVVTHKLISNAVYETLADAKLDWELIAPFLESAREMAQADFDEAELRL